MGQKTLEITVKIGCKNMCSYCPQKQLLSAYKDAKKSMSFEDFKVIMNNVPKDVQIDFSGFAEPFLNPEASLMMRYSLENGWRTIIYTTLVGFTEKDAEILKDLTFTNVAVHKFDGKNFNEEEFNKNYEILKNTIKSTGNFSAGGIGQPLSRGGNLWERKDILGPLYCYPAPDDFNHNVVLPNGDVVICCMDYGLKHKIGNLFETHYDNLDRKSIHALSDTYNSDFLCRKCELAREKYPKNW